VSGSSVLSVCLRFLGVVCFMGFWCVFLVLFLVMFKSLVFVIICGDVVGYCFC